MNPIAFIIGFTIGLFVCGLALKARKEYEPEDRKVAFGFWLIVVLGVGVIALID